MGHLVHKRALKDRAKFMPFKIGDLVQITSGGLAMTVADITDSGIECWWLEGRKQRSHIFKSDALKEASPPLTLEALVGQSFKQ